MCNHKINWRSTILQLVYKTNLEKKRYLHLSRIDAPESSNKVSFSWSFMSLFLGNSANKFRFMKLILSYKTLSSLFIYAMLYQFIWYSRNSHKTPIETVLMSLSSYCSSGSYRSMRNTNFEYKTSTIIFAEKIKPRLI